MTIRKKIFPAHVKALTDADKPGTFEAIVSVFGNVDLVGDRMVFGAFKDSLAKWKAGPDALPVIWAHQWENIDAHIGEAIEYEELPPGDERLPEKLKEFGGLYIKGVNDLEEEYARKVHKRMERRLIKEFSFAYDVLDEEEAEDGANDVKAVDLIEVGPCLKGANELTDHMGAKTTPAATAAASAEAEKAIAGSIEERQDRIWTALEAAYAVQSENRDERRYVWLIATFDDKVLFAIEQVGEDPKTYEVGYTIEGDEVTLGDPSEVVLETIVKPKSRRGAKVGRTISAKNEEKLRNAQGLINEVLSQLDGQEDDGEDPKTAKPEGHEVKGEEPGAGTDLSPEDALLRADILETV